jgi:hypothetical protein
LKFASIHEQSHAYIATPVAWLQISHMVSMQELSHGKSRRLSPCKAQRFRLFHTLRPPETTSLSSLHLTFTHHKDSTTCTTPPPNNKMSTSSTEDEPPSVQSRHPMSTAYQAEVDNANDWLASNTLVPSTCPFSAATKIITTETSLGKSILSKYDPPKLQGLYATMRILERIHIVGDLR